MGRRCCLPSLIAPTVPPHRDTFGHAAADFSASTQSRPPRYNATMFTVILHSPADDVVLFTDSPELVRNSGRYISAAWTSRIRSSRYFFSSFAASQ